MRREDAVGRLRENRGRWEVLGVGDWIGARVNSQGGDSARERESRQKIGSGKGEAGPVGGEAGVEFGTTSGKGDCETPGRGSHGREQGKFRDGMAGRWEIRAEFRREGD